MAILSKYTTIGGKKPLTTDSLYDNLQGVIQVDLSDNVDLNNIVFAGNYTINNVSSISNFPNECTIDSINTTGAHLTVLSTNTDKRIQIFNNESLTLIRYKINEDTWTSWKQYGSDSNSKDIIINVTNFPTTDIEENVFYRLIKAYFIYNNETAEELNIDYECICVDKLPDVGEPVCANTDLNNIYAYYNLSDGDVYGYVNDTLSGIFKLDIGWQYIDTIISCIGQYEYNGVVYSIEDEYEDDKLRVWISSELYCYYKGSWLSVSNNNKNINTELEKLKISMWKQNIKYKVGDIILAIDSDGYSYIGICKFNHTSLNNATPFEGDDYDNWTFKNISSYYSNIANKARQDYNGNIIHDTYATKSELESRISDEISELINNAPEALDTLNELAKALGDDPNFATTITNELSKKANTEDVASNYATKEELLNNIETINLTSITNNTITTSNELGSLRASKIYQLKIGDKTGWLIVSRLEEYEKNICQTLIDLDGSIYNRYHSEAGVGEEGWSEWEPYATKSDVDSKISDALDDRGIQIVRLNYNGTDVPNYDEFTTVGIYRINYEGRISWLIVANHNDLYHGITQILISSIGQISTRYNYVDETIADSVWTDWVEYITKDMVDTALSDTSTNPVQNKVIKQAIDLKAEQLELERLKYYGDKDIIPSDKNYFTVNETGETITGLTDTGKTQTELVIPYKINGKEITTLSYIGNNSILDGNTVITKVVIPNSVTSIAEAAFKSCDSLTSINIPNSVIYIGDEVFTDCSGLTSIDIPNSVTRIGMIAFHSCTGLTSITIPSSITSIDVATFHSCTSLTSIEIPNSVTSIDSDAFFNCTNLKIYCEEGSYAETYAQTNNIPVIYTDIKAEIIDNIMKDSLEITEDYSNTHYNMSELYESINLEVKEDERFSLFPKNVTYGKNYTSYFDLPEPIKLGSTDVTLEKINKTTFYIYGTLNSGESFNTGWLYNFSNSDIPKGTTLNITASCVKLGGNDDNSGTFAIQFTGCGLLYLKGLRGSIFSKNVSITTPSIQQNYGLSFQSNVTGSYTFNHLVTIDIIEATTNTVSINEFDGTYHENISTSPYESKISTNIKTKDYIDIKDNEIKKYVDNNLSHTQVEQLYLTPEAYGAKADGSDDADAIQSCINDALQKGLPVKGFKTYTISKPIIFPEFDGTKYPLSLFSCYIHGLKTTESNTQGAIIIKGERTEIVVDYISTQSCDAVIFKGEQVDKIVKNHVVKIGWIYSKRNGVVFNSEQAPICSVKLDFNLIQAGDYNGDTEYCGIIGVGQYYITEINVTGGQIRYSHYAVSGRICGRFYNVQVEERVQGGFNLTKAGSTIFYDRHTESSRDGSLPFLKIGDFSYDEEGNMIDTPPTSVFVDSLCTFNYESLNPIPINEIDISGQPIFYTTGDGALHPIKLWYGRIKCPIGAANKETGSDITNYSGVLANEAIVWGKKLILSPYREFTQKITNNFDNRLNDYSLFQLPTEFVIEDFDNSVTEDYITINLNASYCFLGFSSFKVVQKNNKKAKVYDFDNNLIFDGTEFNDGTYILTHYQTTKLMPDYSGDGLAWRIDRLQDYKDYTDSLERALETGLITVEKAKADMNGNQIDTTYETKANVSAQISEAILKQGIQVITVNNNPPPYYFVHETFLDSIIDIGLYKIQSVFTTDNIGVGWLIVGYQDTAKLNVAQVLIDSDGTIYKRYRGADDGLTQVWSEWIKYMTQDIANNTYLSKTDAQNTYLTQSDAAATYLLPISPQVIQFTDVEEYDDIIAPGIYKNKHNIDTTWLIVSQHDSAEHDYTQIKITSLGVIGYRYHNPSDSTWSNWIYYSTQEEIKPKISMWKPNTHYYIDDTVIALDPDGYYYTATCKTEHISSNIDSMFMGDTSYWTIKSISSKQSFSAIYATDAGRSTQAEEDADGNIITATYATKEELRPTPITDISSTIIANKSYNYGEQTELSIAFPAVANDGDVVYITFTSGATATVLTIDTTNTSDIELIPEANTGYEVYAKYNGTIWIVNYSDYTITAEAGA